MSEPLHFTGERFMPGLAGEIGYEHWHRYVVARRFCEAKTVLDVACGEGYGSAMLARSAASVTGVDISEASIEHARRRYRAPHLEFRSADCLNLPFDYDSFDSIVSFETLEHLADHPLAAIGNHTTDHAILTVETPEERRAQIEGAQAALEEMTGAAPTMIAAAVAAHEAQAAEAGASETDGADDDGAETAGD